MERPQSAQERLDRTVREYADALRTLPAFIRETTRKMSLMREAGIPDREAYEKLRSDLTKTYDGFKDISQRIVDYKEELEDSYKAAVESDATWHQAKAEKGEFGRRDTDYGEYQKRLIPPEIYDERVMKLQEMVAAWESNVELLIRKNRFSRVDATYFQQQLDDVQEKLQDLDAEAFDPAASRERKSLMHMIDQLRARLVKGAYAAVAHELTEPQRRDMRSYIARLTGLVNELKPIPPPEPPLKPLRNAITLAMAHASRTAPVITASVVRIRKSRP